MCQEYALEAQHRTNFKGTTILARRTGYMNRVVEEATEIGYTPKA
jgi:hypothetical protein